MPGASVERVAAGARPSGVRVVDREALLLDRVHEVDGRAHEVRRAHLVRDHLDTAERGHDVAVEGALVEVQVVTQSRAAARLHSHTQPQIIPALLAEQRANLGGGRLSEDDALARLFVLNGHLRLAPVLVMPPMRHRRTPSTICPGLTFRATPRDQVLPRPGTTWSGLARSSGRHRARPWSAARARCPCAPLTGART